MSKMYKKRDKKITLLEFKAWLEGVEDTQPSGWSPSPEQWVVIRNKLRSIDPSATIVTHKGSPMSPSGAHFTEVPAEPIGPVSRPSSAPRTGKHPVNLLRLPPPPVPGSVPNDPIVTSDAAAIMMGAVPTGVQMTDAARAALSGRLPPQPAPGSIPPGSVSASPKSFV